MDREISVALHLGVSLIALSVTISIVWFTVFFGKEVAQDVSVESSGIVGTATVGMLEELIGHDDIIMPAAAAYSIVRSYGLYIECFDCDICNNNGQKPYEKDTCLQKHLRDKISLRAEKTDTGGYKLSVSST